MISLSQRTFEPPQVKHDRLMVVSVAGFVVNLIGIFVFHHGGSGQLQCIIILIPFHDNVSHH